MVTLKKILLALMAFGLMFVLSGCYNLNADMTVNAEDDTVSGTITFAFPKSYGQAYQDMLPKSDAVPPGVTIATYDNGRDADDEGLKGIKYTLDRVKFSDLQKPDSDGRKLPFTVAKDEEGTYVFRGDFSKWFPGKDAIRAMGLTPPRSVPKPKIDFQFTFPYNISKAPKGLNVTGPTFKLDRTWLEANKKFEVKAAATGEGVDVPSFEDFPSREPFDTSAYPIQGSARNPLPSYLFGALLFLGIGAILYGHFSVRSRGK